MQLEWLDAAEIVKISHVAEIVNIRHVARILEAEICGAENVRAIPLYNLFDPCLFSLWGIPCHEIPWFLIPHEELRCILSVIVSYQDKSESTRIFV